MVLNNNKKSKLSGSAIRSWWVSKKALLTPCGRFREPAGGELSAQHRRHTNVNKTMCARIKSNARYLSVGLACEDTRSCTCCSCKLGVVTSEAATVSSGLSSILLHIRCTIVRLSNRRLLSFNFPPRLIKWSFLSAHRSHDNERASETLTGTKKIYEEDRGGIKLRRPTCRTWSCALH